MRPPVPRLAPLEHAAFMTFLIVMPLFAIAASGDAQTPATIDPGMTQDSVIKRLGQPLSIRTYGSHTYLLYPNGCEKNCGMSDLVTLDSGRVVDAIFRSSARRFSGKSSSPDMIPAALARGAMSGDSGRPHHVTLPPGLTRAEPRMDSAKTPRVEKRPATVKKAATEEKTAPEKKMSSEKKAPEKNAPEKQVPEKKAPVEKKAPEMTKAPHAADTSKKAAPPKKPD